MSNPGSNPMTAVEHVIHILSLTHPTPGKRLHPGTIGSAIYYMQKWTDLQGHPPDKIAAKENGNIAMIWEQNRPHIAIDVSATKQEAEVLMQSEDNTTTVKKNTDGDDAKALETVVNILQAVVGAAYTEQETPDEPTEATVVAG
jgi:hypothetical protein